MRREAKQNVKPWTSLANGEKRAKTDPIFEALGSLDELAAWLSLVLATTEPREAHFQQLDDALSAVHEIGARLAQAQAGDELAKRLEKLKTAYERLYPDRPKEFLRFSDNQPAARIDYLRSLVRRCERRVLALGSSPLLDEASLYLDLFADWLFLVASSLVKSRKERR